MEDIPKRRNIRKARRNLLVPTLQRWNVIVRHSCAKRLWDFTWSVGEIKRRVVSDKFANLFLCSQKGTIEIITQSVS